MLKSFKNLFIVLFLISVIGYIFSVLKEKLYLKNNIIIIDKKSVTKEHLNEADMKEFVLDGCRLRAGDEIKLFTNNKKSFKGIIIGAKKKEKLILLVTHDDKIHKFRIQEINKFKIISKYGKFFT